MFKIRGHLALGLACLFFWAVANPARAGQGPIVRIGTVLDGPWTRNTEVPGLVEEEILALTEGEFDVRFPDSKQIVGDWTPASVSAALDQLIADPGVDLVLALGVLSSDNACRRGPLPKPVVAAAVIDATVQGLPAAHGTSGVRNLCYITIPSTIERDIHMFKEVAPFTRMAFLVTRPVVDGIPELGPRVQRLASGIGVETVTVPVGRSAGSALAAIPLDVEAVYVTPLLHLSSSAFDSLVSGFIVRGLPSFSMLGEREVRQGILAGLNPDLFPRLLRRLAVNVQRILLGDEPGTVPVAFSVGERLMINIGTAEAIGRYPSWAVLIEAEVVGERQAPIERELTLTMAVTEAIEANLDLRAADRVVSAGAEEVRRARAFLLPQVGTSALGLVIDEDRAAASFGSQAERTVSVSAGLEQVVFSESARANLAIQRHLQTSREEEREAVRLDITEEMATAYLNLLRAKTLERVSKGNLALSRTNLELARVRQSVGVSGPSDVLRWESQIATNRKTAIAAVAQRNLAEMDVNRILHQPVEEPFRTRETENVGDPLGLDALDRDRARLVEDYPYLFYFGDKLSFRALRDFLVEEGIAHSPELRGLAAGIAALERSYTAAGRAFWLPDLALRGDVTHRVSKDGAGSERTDLSSIDPRLAGIFPAIDDTDWSVGLSLSYPLFRGGSKFAERAQAREELARLRVERQAAAERIEQRVRSALHLAGSSYAGIQQAINAAEAARGNLELVTDNYSQGTVSIIDLLDAQNAFVIAEVEAANAVYDFQIDLIQVQRALGRFDPLMSPEERAAFRQRLDEAMARAGARPTGR